MKMPRKARTVTLVAATYLTVLTVHAREGLQPAQTGDARAPHMAEAAALRARGQLLGYNLDRDAALASFREAIAADPADPAAYRLTAATLWIGELFQQGAVSAEDYLGQARSDVQRTPPAAQLDTAFRENLERALTLAEQRCRASGSADAHFQLGAAYGYQATYAATIEGSLFGTLRAARRAYAEHARVLELDPGRKDAGLIVGMYRYAVSSLSLPSRVVARMAGFAGGRDRGLRMVEEAAAYPSDVQTNARFTLIVIYNREARFDDALRVIAELQREYPRNRLLWLEAGSHGAQGWTPGDGPRVARAWAGDAGRRSAAARVRRARPLALSLRRRARGAQRRHRRPTARSTPRSRIRRGPGCRAASTRRSGSSPIAPAIACRHSLNIATRSACAAETTMTYASRLPGDLVQRGHR